MEANLTREHTRGNFSNCFQITKVHFDASDVAIEVFKCIITASTGITAVFANVVVLLSIWRNTSLHTPSNVLLLSLALSDLGIGLVVQPLFVAGIIAKVKRMVGEFCIFAVLSNSSGYWLCCVSLMTMAAISLERYLALYLHLRYREVVTVKRVVMLLLIVWMLGAFVGVTWLLNRRAGHVISVVVISLSILLTSFAYCKIYRVVRYHQAQIQPTIHSQETKNKALELNNFKRSTISMFLIYSLLVICYFPYICVLITILNSSELKSSNVSAIEFASIIVQINSTLNPLVYCWRLSEIREAVRGTLRVICRISSPSS